MLYIPIRNYDEFRDNFGTPSARTNKIVLAGLKSPLYWDYVKNTQPDYRRLWSASMLYSYSRDEFNAHYHPTDSEEVENVCGWVLNNSEYRLDSDGICYDGDSRAIRYARRSDGKIYKMRAAKYLRKVMETRNLITFFSEPVVNFLVEEFQHEWKAYASAEIAKSNYKLVIDDDFESIYSSRCCASSRFGSCMTDNKQYSFYEYAIKAKAASLRNEDDKVVARCIIYTEVYDEQGEKYHLAERQYATDEQEGLKRLLVIRLIAAGAIDGYKAVGAGCGHARSFVSVNGDDWSDKVFHLACHLEPGDTLSYQDSFKWYYMDSHTAYNDSGMESSEEFDLATTDSEFEYGEWDDYHDEYCRRTVECYYHGQWIQVNEDRLDDFCWCEKVDAYYHIDDCFYDEADREYYPNENGVYCEDDYETHCRANAYYSEILEQYYADDDNRIDAEREYMADSPYYRYNQETDEYEEIRVYYMCSYGDSFSLRRSTLFDFERIMRYIKFTFLNGYYYVADTRDAIEEVINLNTIETYE